MQQIQQTGSAITKRSELLHNPLRNEKLRDASYSIWLMVALIGLVCIPVISQVGPHDNPEVRPNKPKPKTPPKRVTPSTVRKLPSKIGRSNNPTPSRTKETKPESTAGVVPTPTPANNVLSATPSMEPKVEAKRSSIPLMPFIFDVVTVNVRRNEPERRKGQARYFSENIGGVMLEMMEIPAGTFWMGSSEVEAEQVRREGELTGKDASSVATLAQAESPRHQVRVPLFYMGKFEVTQAQWRAVARLESISRDLSPAPSHFKGDNLPVENITWDEAMEFCLRLSALTGKKYRLPSEAEWEYTCRAGTVTPFHFGEITASWLLNYCGSYPFGSVAKGVCREQTTPVGYLEVANAFGLYDMHGNVWEWCADSWHDNYTNAPSNGSVWEGGVNKSDRVMRGGSWMTFGYRARSATRASAAPNSKANDHGFRVVAEAANN
jgi:formylglycine-generating enzyme required for sulfatase activity